MASLKLHLFGGLQILFDDTPLSGISKKEQALLSYLAVTRRSWSRETLSGLLWSEVDEDKARKSLGVALTHLRRHLPDYLHITRWEIGLKQNPAYWLDVSVFLQAIPVQSDNGFEPVELLVQTELSPESAAQLKEAVDLYQGYFLDGFSVIHAPLFEEWVFNKREQFQMLAIQGLYRLGGDALQRTAYVEAVAYLRRLIKLDPLQEEAQRFLMLAHARLGQRGAAIQQYETCRRLLLDELGLTPMPQTTALYEQIQTGDFTPAEPQNGPAVYLPGRYNLPAEVTSFVGRETELADLAHKLKSSDQRLFTLVGPGGVGKTRLAIAASGNLTDQFAGGIWFVPLANQSTPAAAETPAMLVTAMAIALEFSFSGPKSPQEQILNYLRRTASPTLFIFDNFEPYLFDAGFLLEILQVTPSVTLLLTSRSRLNFQSEHVIPVTGLPVPPVINSPEAAAYDSVQLFGQRAAQQESGFTLTRENLPSVARLCQLVQGSPLAIELATTRLPELSCAEIVARLQQDIDVLTTSLQDIPVRHQSIRTVFEQAWQFLSEPEQLLLAQISPFYGAITPEAAQAVTRIEAKYLKTLVQKFLLQEISAEHYELHSLLRQFAREKLQGFIAQEVLHETDVWENYSLYHLNLARLSAAPDYLMENLRQAWLWIVDQPRFDLIEQYTAAVAHQFVSAGLFEDGESAFRATLDKIRPASSLPEPADPAYLNASAAVLWAHALFLNRMTRYEAAAAAAQTTVSLARQTGHHHWQAAGHLQWGYACVTMGLITRRRRRSLNRSFCLPAIRLRLK